MIMICGRNLTGKEVESMQRVKLKARGQGTFGTSSCRVVVHEGICLREGSRQCNWSSLAIGHWWSLISGVEDTFQGTLQDLRSQTRAYSQTDWRRERATVNCLPCYWCL
jgi:hypothetical protein